MKKKSYTILLSLLTLLFFSACSDSDELDDLDLFDFTSTAVDVSAVEGKWYTTLEIDSTVIVFEKGYMKEYVYQKGTDIILARTDYGLYKLWERAYKNSRRVEHVLITSDGWYGFEYILNDSSLALKLSDDNIATEFIQYTKIVE